MNNNNNNHNNYANTLNYSKDLVLYRTNIGSIIKQNYKIAFYGLSKRGIRTYFKEEPENEPKFYYKFILPKKLTERIVNLEDPENQKIIDNFLKTNNVPSFIKNGNLNSIRHAYRYKENNGKYYRFSNNSDIDRRFGYTLKNISKSYWILYKSKGLIMQKLLFGIMMLINIFMNLMKELNQIQMIFYHQILKKKESINQIVIIIIIIIIMDIDTEIIHLLLRN